jgi:hypothetical protein
MEKICNCTNAAPRFFDFSQSDKDKMISEKECMNKLDMLLKEPLLKTGLSYTGSHEVISPTSGSTEAIIL